MRIRAAALGRWCWNGFGRALCRVQLHRLGHLHRPQRLSGGKVCYSGSLLKYSFDETAHTKSVSVVEIDAAGKATVELVSLRPRRDVRCLEGTFKTLLENRDLRTDDYVKIRLLDQEVLFEPLNRLRECYPNVLDLDYAYRDLPVNQPAHRVDHTKMQPVDLFKAFYQYAENVALSEDQTQALTTAVTKLEKERAE